MTEQELAEFEARADEVRGYGGGEEPWPMVGLSPDEAEVRRLRAENERLRAALEQLAKLRGSTFEARPIAAKARALARAALGKPPDRQAAEPVLD